MFRPANRVRERWRDVIENYEEQVYAGVLGKVIGVYMGRPFEGWSKKALEDKWGQVDRYVHEDRGVPLVVADDDISGTLTFIRALEDSGLYEETPPAFFGDTWLNYLIEGLTVLWWGGMGHSTEHTAYLRLKHGMKAPHSGSVETNGRTVAEQIGAQIFIDAFGLVAPGDPQLAARLATMAASVSHGGEAVNGAVVVAGMISAAFVEKDMEKLLDIGASLIPKDSLIAQVHKDVRSWAKEDGDWRTTYDRIDEKYGYSKYGGNCHMIPNHAIMVMAWAYAPNDFHRSQMIINTAGWDTDCNAANVGALMGVKVGLEGINEKCEFQKPFADRIILPTAEGTRSVTDCLAEALHIARIGRKIMKWDELAPPKGGAIHHFTMPGALHGYVSESDTLATSGAFDVANVPAGEGRRDRAMEISYEVDAGRRALVSTPVLPHAGKSGAYGVAGIPRLYPGMRVDVHASSLETTGAPRARLVARCALVDGEERAREIKGDAVALASGADVALGLTLPACDGIPYQSLGIEITSSGRATGALQVDSVSFSGKAVMAFPVQLPRVGGAIPGWLSDADVQRGKFSDDAEEQMRMGKNEGRGIFVTGTAHWTDYTFASRFGVHMADAAGILVRYQGLQRYVALVKTKAKLQLVMRFYGDTVLAEMPCAWEPDALHALELRCEGTKVVASLDGAVVLEGVDDKLGGGGAGFLFENGLVGFRDVKVG
jgi:ADP-ribosylglycohydrolase